MTHRKLGVGDSGPVTPVLWVGLAGGCLWEGRASTHGHVLLLWVVMTGSGYVFPEALITACREGRGAADVLPPFLSIGSVLEGSQGFEHSEH